MILRNINSPIKVVAVNRLNRRITRTPNIDSQEDAATPITYTPSLIVSLIFEGQKIPNYIVMFHVRYPVSPYIARVSRCNQCFRFGHIKANCKSQPRCAHCEGKGHTFSKEQCQHSEDPPKCANCKGDHRVDSPSCPELITQKEIRNLNDLSALNIQVHLKANSRIGGGEESAHRWRRLVSNVQPEI